MDSAACRRHDQTGAQTPQGCASTFQLKNAIYVFNIVVFESGWTVMQCSGIGFLQHIWLIHQPKARLLINYFLKKHQNPLFCRKHCRNSAHNNKKRWILFLAGCIALLSSFVQLEDFGTGNAWIAPTTASDKPRTATMPWWRGGLMNAQWMALGR